MSANNWLQKIATSVEHRDDDYDDRSGQTLFSSIADEVRSTSVGNQDHRDIVASIEFLVSKYLLESNVSNLASLAQLVALGQIRSESLGKLTYRLWQRSDIPASARTSLLLILSTSGRRLAPGELEKEETVRNDTPLVWIDSWARSHPIAHWGNHVKKLLQERKISFADIEARLPAWYQSFGYELLSVASQWMVVLLQPDQHELSMWLRAREPGGNISSTWQSQLTTSTSEAHPSILGTHTVTFLHEAKGQAIILNGPRPE